MVGGREVVDDAFISVPQARQKRSRNFTGIVFSVLLLCSAPQVFERKSTKGEERDGASKQ